jgi:hypothetical protein
MNPNLFYGILYGIMGQILSFLQLQGSVKYGWYKEYPIITLLASIPASWFYLKSVEALVILFNGQLWPSRLIGFGIGIVVFISLSIILFKEPVSLKTLVCLMLALSILSIQLFWK